MAFMLGINPRTFQSNSMHTVTGYLSRKTVAYRLPSNTLEADKPGSQIPVGLIE